MLKNERKKSLTNASISIKLTIFVPMSTENKNMNCNITSILANVALSGQSGPVTTRARGRRLNTTSSRYVRGTVRAVRLFPNACGNPENVFSTFARSARSRADVFSISAQRAGSRANAFSTSAQRAGSQANAFSASAQRAGTRRTRSTAPRSVRETKRTCSIASFLRLQGV